MSSPVEDMLEKRITELENRIFGLEGRPKEDVLPESNVIESLSHANTLISSALSGREKLNTLIQRLPEIENFKEPDSDIDLDLEAKLEYILASEPEIRETAQKIKQFKELLPVLESNPFNELPEMSEKLNGLTLKYIELGKEADVVNAETKNMISKYNEIIKNISQTLINIDAEITEREKAVETKKVLD